MIFDWVYIICDSHRKKRAKQVKKLMQRGLLDPEKVDPFSLFLETGGITYCLYKDSERILGNTFGMCILQVDTPEMFFIFIIIIIQLFAWLIIGCLKIVTIFYNHHFLILGF